MLRKGDCCRYLAEILDVDQRVEVTEQAELAYEAALKVAEQELSILNPILLRLILNYAVFNYEISGCHEKASSLLANAVQDSESALQGQQTNIPQTLLQDSLMILDLMKSDLQLWASNATQNRVVYSTTSMPEVHDQQLSLMPSPSYP